MFNTTIALAPGRRALELIGYGGHRRASTHRELARIETSIHGVTATPQSLVAKGLDVQRRFPGYPAFFYTVGGSSPGANWYGDEFERFGGEVAGHLGFAAYFLARHLNQFGRFDFHGLFLNLGRDDQLCLLTEAMARYCLRQEIRRATTRLNLARRQHYPAAPMIANFDANGQVYYLGDNQLPNDGGNGGEANGESAGADLGAALRCDQSRYSLLDQSLALMVDRPSEIQPVLRAVVGEPFAPSDFGVRRGTPLADCLDKIRELKLEKAESEQVLGVIAAYARSSPRNMGVGREAEIAREVARQNLDLEQDLRRWRERAAEAARQEQLLLEGRKRQAADEARRRKEEDESRKKQKKVEQEAAAAALGKAPGAAAPDKVPAVVRRFGPDSPDENGLWPVELEGDLPLPNAEGEAGSGSPAGRIEPGLQAPAEPAVIGHPRAGVGEARPPVATASPPPEVAIEQVSPDDLIQENAARVVEVNWSLALRWARSSQSIIASITDRDGLQDLKWKARQFYQKAKRQRATNGPAWAELSRLLNPEVFGQAVEDWLQRLAARAATPAEAVSAGPNSPGASAGVPVETARVEPWPMTQAETGSVPAQPAAAKVPIGTMQPAVVEAVAVTEDRSKSVAQPAATEKVSEPKETGAAPPEAGGGWPAPFVSEPKAKAELSAENVEKEPRAAEPTVGGATAGAGSNRETTRNVAGEDAVKSPATRVQAGAESITEKRAVYPPVATIPEPAGSKTVRSEGPVPEKISGGVIGNEAAAVQPGLSAVAGAGKADANSKSLVAGIAATGVAIAPVASAQPGPQSPVVPVTRGPGGEVSAGKPGAGVTPLPATPVVSPRPVPESKVGQTTLPETGVKAGSVVSPPRAAGIASQPPKPPQPVAASKNAGETPVPVGGSQPRPPTGKTATPAPAPRPATGKTASGSPALAGRQKSVGVTAENLKGRKTAVPAKRVEDDAELQKFGEDLPRPGEWAYASKWLRDFEDSGLLHGPAERRTLAFGAIRVLLRESASTPDGAKSALEFKNAVTRFVDDLRSRGQFEAFNLVEPSDWTRVERSERKAHAAELKELQKAVEKIEDLSTRLVSDQGGSPEWKAEFIRISKLAPEVRQILVDLKDLRARRSIDPNWTANDRKRLIQCGVLESDAKEVEQKFAFLRKLRQPAREAEHPAQDKTEMER